MFDLLRPHESFLSWVVFGLVLIGLTVSVSNAFLDTTVWQLEAQRYLTEPVQKASSDGFATSNWKIYRNEEYGFELSHPTDWKLTEYSSGTSIILDPPNNPGIAKTYFSLSIQNKTLGTIRAAMPPEVAREGIVVAGRASDKYIYDSTHASVYIPFDDRVGVYGIDLYTPPGVDEPNQILPTFRFVEPIDTSTWKTYRNEQYGFEVKYPDMNAHFKAVGGWANNNEPEIISRTPFDYSECVTVGNPLPGVPQKSKLTIAGRQYCLIVLSGGGAAGSGGTSYEYISRVGNEDIGISFQVIYPLDKGISLNQDARSLFDQILSTFKFTEPK